ncbi:uncharacterized protein LOC114188420 [Vigna unguiculata]|uniref:uncharacterized protein LOC114188420 n=1 Tax=Vigna unguiculata TaxID=3917 RepID=UPI00101637F9|nr:uncharacterized protein LOC114188420 [Vigna unguiculata]
MSKYCQYHHNNGYTTEECETLRDKVEELNRIGHLKHYVKNTGEEGSRPRYDKTDNGRFERREERRPEHKESRREPGRNPNLERRMEQQQQDKRLDDRPPMRGTINTISRGFAGGGRFSSSRKRHLRAIQSVHAIVGRSQRRMPPIIFTNSDFRGFDPNQDDLMVITVELKSSAIKKILVDQGSSVDILYWKTFEKLQIPLEDLAPYDKSIYDFARERVPTRGYVDLHTTFRWGREIKTIPIRYLVVDTHISYNMLLGRPSLNALGAVVSTPTLP